MSALPKTRFKRLFRLSYTNKNIKRKIRIKSRKKIESNLYLLKRRITSYYGLTQYNDLKQHSTSPSFLANLETRADVVLFRLHWTKSIFEARDMIRKGILWVGSEIITNPHQLLPLKTVFSLISCCLNANITAIPQLFSTNISKKLLNRILRKKIRLIKFQQLNSLTKIRARPYLNKFWNKWLYCPPHLFVDHGIQIASIIQWPTYPYKYIPYKNLEALGQYLKHV